MLYNKKDIETSIYILRTLFYFIFSGSVYPLISSTKKWTSARVRIASENSPTHNIACVLSSTSKHNLNVLHIFQILWWGKKYQYSTRHLVFSMQHTVTAEPP